MKKSLLTFIVGGMLFTSCIKDHIGHGGGGNDDDNVDVSTLTFAKIGGFTNGAGEEGFAEISAFDPKTNKLFVVNPVETEVSVWDITSPSLSVKLTSISLAGTPNSVAVHDGVLAVAVENANKQMNGTIQTYNTESQTLMHTYNVGALPDMVTFSPNGKFIISANEGEPNDDYTVDPEGSVSVVDVQKNEVNTLFFTNCDAASIGNNFRVFGPNASAAQDIEPEYVAISDDSKYAYVSLQENNGMAVVDLKAMTISNVFGLGVKDHSLPENKLDASNEDGIVGNFQNWPVLGFFMPDAITYTELNGIGYIISANEGDSRDYDGYSEEERVKDLILDPTVFPNAADLQMDENIGRLKTTTANGDTDGDGDFDEIYAYGARSFSIWSTSGDLVYDSADEIGRKTLEVNPAYFNADEGEADGRSDDKGAEPESVTTLKVGESTLLFVGLERSGGVLVYDITNPNSPEYVNWLFDAMDVAPEGLLAVSKEDSPTGNALVVVTNEVSNTIAFYEIK
ncbi:choice-of-anchor I family protein [Arenibacter sp. F20364]|uniref:choice-of-anchor I family protein n=1 Tax=Arenibacter sp. F20364 TaxID=2926415 RepID=UPI001FF17618|nr:choice-of-anchor I family protein [Arenibacter sp. F20364]MCK0191583.1 choice-of-anchor I family protein [Arenibacter sp. F20364]